MNHSYHLVWNAQTERYVPAPETARNKGKTKTRKALLLAVLMLGGALALPALVQAAAPDIAASTLPQGGQIVAGQARISQSAQQMTVNQDTQKAILNWQSFNIGKDAGVNFQQPNSNAIALNRVIAGDASHIQGQLTANGQVWLINPNGVVFGKDSRVDVGGLVATTLDIANKDFLDGRYTLNRNQATGGITNQGELTAQAGGYIALLAPTVTNDGIITAQLGTVALAAGDKITLQAGVNGLLNVTVTPATLQTLIDNKQLIVADGGQIIMTGKAADALSGSIVSNTGTLQANTLQEKDGRILLLADMQHGEIKQNGQLTARAPETGHGGFIETSAAKVSIGAHAKVDTSAAQGQTGTWLIDPTDFTIAASGGDITGAALASALASTDVTIQTTDTAASCTGATCGTGSSGNGDIHVNDSVSWNAKTLTLNAWRNININQTLDASAGGSLSLQYGQGSTDGTISGTPATYNVNAPVNLASSSSFTTQLGSTGAVKSYTVITSLGAAGSATGTDLQGMSGNLSGNYALGSNIDASPTSGWNSGAGFVPIGNDSSKFTGTFDGLSHSINSLNINCPSEYNVGLFGYLGTGAVIQNLGLEGGSVKGGNYVGALVGYNDGSTITKSYATGSVSGSGYYTGGLVGYNANNSTISNSYATGSVTGADFVGGLVAANDNSTISNSYATGSATGTGYVGGLVGLHSGGSITSSYYATTDNNGNAINNNGNTSGAWAGNANGEAKTWADLKLAITYSSWNMDDAGGTGKIWRIYGGDTHPLLRAFLAPKTISVTPDITKTYDGKTEGALDAIAGMDADKIFYGGTQNAKNVGTYNGVTLYSNQQGYDLVGTRTAKLTITPKALNVTGSTAANRDYDGSTQATINVGTLGGFAGTETLTATATGSFDSKDAGSRNVTAHYTLADGNNGGLATNYSLADTPSLTATITPKALNVTGTAAANRDYDGSTLATINVGTLGGFAGTETLTATATGSFDSKNAGPRTTTAHYTLADGNNGELATNYSLADTPGLGATISKANLTVSTEAISKPYDGTTAATGAAAKVTNGTLFSGDSLTGGSFAFADKNAGTSKTVNVTGVTVNDGNSGNNYTLTLADNTASTITPKALTVSGLSAADKPYDGHDSANITQWGSASTGVGAETLGLNHDPDAHFDNKNAGTAKIVTATGYSLADGTQGELASNYTLTSSTATTTATIDPKALTVTDTTAASRPYDGTTNASITVGALLGFVNGETLTATATGSFDSKNAGSRNATAHYALADGNNGGLATNYSLADTTGLTAIIAQANATVTANSATLTYNGQTQSVTGFTATGLVNGETAAVLTGVSTSGGSGTNVGSYPHIASGSDTNYNLTLIDGNLKIVAAPPSEPPSPPAEPPKPPVEPPQPPTPPTPPVEPPQPPQPPVYPPVPPVEPPAPPIHPTPPIPPTPPVEPPQPPQPPQPPVEPPQPPQPPTPPTPPVSPPVSPIPPLPPLPPQPSNPPVNLLVPPQVLSSIANIQIQSNPNSLMGSLTGMSARFAPSEPPVPATDTSPSQGTSQAAGNTVGNTGSSNTGVNTGSNTAIIAPTVPFLTVAPGYISLNQMDDESPE